MSHDIASFSIQQSHRSSTENISQDFDIEPLILIKVSAININRYVHSTRRNDKAFGFALTFSTEKSINWPWFCLYEFSTSFCADHVRKAVVVMFAMVKRATSLHFSVVFIINVARRRIRIAFRLMSGLWSMDPFALGPHQVDWTNEKKTTINCEGREVELTV